MADASGTAEFLRPKHFFDCCTNAEAFTLYPRGLRFRNKDGLDILMGPGVKFIKLVSLPRRALYGLERRQGRAYPCSGRKGPVAGFKANLWASNKQVKTAGTGIMGLRLSRPMRSAKLPKSRARHPAAGWRQAVRLMASQNVAISTPAPGSRKLRLMASAFTICARTLKRFSKLCQGTFMRHHHHFHQTIIAAIRTRAYEIWENEGRPEGHAVEHWLLAETEINPDEDEDGGEP
jgi:Protein of unknown function (DUF2934)